LLVKIILAVLVPISLLSLVAVEQTATFRAVAVLEGCVVY
jgi:hypothetical protein